MTRRQQRSDDDATATAELLAMLAMPRPHDSAAERAFTTRWLADLPSDGFGNRIASIGPAPRVLWSAHIDTVDRRQDRKRVVLDGDTVRLGDGKAGTCLGADDTVGVWIMLAMMRAERPGLYVFHRGEERGSLGSMWIAGESPAFLDGIECAVAFDRRGRSNIITHQLGDRCCSATFALELAGALTDAGLPGYRADPGGVFTDTANYTSLVSECTNLSVGYEREHGPSETLSLGHALALRRAMLRLDSDALRAHRDPAPPMVDLWPDEPQWRTYDDPRAWDRPSKGAGRWHGSDSLADLVADYPHLAAELLRDCGLDERAMMQALADSGEL